MPVISSLYCHLQSFCKVQLEQYPTECDLRFCIEHRNGYWALQRQNLFQTLTLQTFFILCNHGESFQSILEKIDYKTTASYHAGGSIVLRSIFSKLITCGDQLISVYLGQYHGYWCPCSLRRQDISSHDIDYIEYLGPSPGWGRILSTCVILMWRNDTKCKYMFMFRLKKIAL